MKRRSGIRRDEDVPGVKRGLVKIPEEQGRREREKIRNLIAHRQKRWEGEEERESRQKKGDASHSLSCHLENVSRIT